MLTAAEGGGVLCLVGGSSMSLRKRGRAEDMLYEYATYPDGLHTAFSERYDDGTYHFVFEWPLPMDMGMARCRLPQMEWDMLHRAGREDISRLEGFLGRNLDIIEDCVDQVSEELALERGGLAHA